MTRQGCWEGSCPRTLIRKGDLIGSFYRFLIVLDEFLEEKDLEIPSYNLFGGRRSSVGLDLYVEGGGA